MMQFIVLSANPLIICFLAVGCDADARSGAQSVFVRTISIGIITFLIWIDIGSSILNRISLDWGDSRRFLPAEKKELWCGSVT